MKRKEFLAWSSQIDKLSKAQKLEISKILAGRTAGESSITATESTTDGKNMDSFVPELDGDFARAFRRFRGSVPADIKLGFE